MAPLDTTGRHRSRWRTRQSIINRSHRKMESDATDRGILVSSRLQLAIVLTGKTRRCTVYGHRAPRVVAHCVK